MLLNSWLTILLALLVAAIIGTISAVGRLSIYTNTRTLYRYEGDDSFVGEIALVGETVNIACRTDREGDSIRKGIKILENNDRITVVSVGLWTNVTIRNVTLDDGDVYRCRGTKRLLRVTDIDKNNPPHIVNHSYYNDNGSLLFVFQTNVKREDTVDWYISHALRNDNSCDSEDCLRMAPCTEQLLWTLDNGYHSVSCLTNFQVDSFLSYAFKIKGQNPFTSNTQMIRGTVDSVHIETLPESFSIDLPEISTTVTPMLTYLIAFNPPAKPFRHIDRLDSYRSFDGYAARKGDNVTYICHLPDTRDAVMYFNHTTSTRDARVIVSSHGSWHNATILHVSAENSGKYMCGSTLTWLTVIDAKKKPNITRHKCLYDRDHNFVCSFYTNSKKRDRISWEIVYSISKPSKDGSKEIYECGDGLCENLKCNTQLAVFSGLQKTDTLTCTAKYIIVGAVYDFTLTAVSPYISESVNTSSTLDHTVMTAAAPTITGSSTTSDSAVLSVNYVPDTVVLNYRITGSSLTPQILYNKTGNSQLLLSNLLAYTEYQLTVMCQFSTTINADVWSDGASVAIHTKQSTPDVPAEVGEASFSFKVPLTNCSHSTRAVTIYWKNIPEEAGAANGVITHYYIFDLDNAPKPLNFSQVLNVLGTKTSASLCVTNDRVRLGLKAATAVGLGKGISNYTIPAASEVIEVTPCDITAQVLGNPKGVEINWDRISLAGHLYYIAYWCKYDSNRQCMDKTLQWKKTDDPKLVLKGDFPGYKFGISANVYNRSLTSGIVWAKCVNYPDSELHAASLLVELSEMKADVMVIEKCRLNSRTPTSNYYVKYCTYDIITSRCTGNEFAISVSLCERSTQVALDEYSSLYAFWVVSVSGTSRAESKKVFISTDKNPLPMLTIVLSCALLLVATFILTVFFVWFCRQKKLAKSLKHPQLVRPSKLPPEQDSCKNVSDKDSIQYSSLHHIEPDNLSESNSLLNEEGKLSNDSSHSVDLAATSGYQPLPLSQLPTSYQQHYKEATSQHSYTDLPDEYIKYTSGPNLSTQLFYNDSSSVGNGIIDLALLLGTPTSKASRTSGTPSTLEYVKLEEVNGDNPREDLHSDSSRPSHSCDINDSDADIYCETDYTDLSSPDCSGGLSLPPE